MWVDPASEHVAIPQIPASMRGATAWVPGDLPIQVASTGVVDGVVSVSGQATLGQGERFAGMGAGVVTIGVVDRVERPLHHIHRVTLGRTCQVPQAAREPNRRAGRPVP